MRAPRIQVFASAVLLVDRRLASFPPGARRHTYEFLEGPIESSLGFVAHLGADIGEACALFDEARRQLKPPARHILHRWDLDELGEPAGKGGARKTDLLRQYIEGPRLRRSSMDQTERLADIRIAQPGE